MLFEQVEKKDILRLVIRNVSKAKKEIIATMLLREELSNPLPAAYFNLLKKKVNEGVFLRRLGFGRKEDYNKIKKKHNFKSNNYEFRYIIHESKYQRLIIIDKKKLFFGTEGLYLTSVYKPLIKVFLDYFDHNFEKGQI